MMMRRALTISLALAVTLAACSGDSDDATADSSAGGSGGDTAFVGGEALDFDGEAPQDQLQVDLEAVDGRRVIRRASLELHATDTRAAFDDILNMISAVGGFVADATVYPTSGEDVQPQITMTLRVPATQLEVVMSDIKASIDDVVSETQGAQDTTEEFVDLEARLTNLQALEVELRALLREVRMQDDADPEKILTVFNEVSSVRGEIEQIQGHLEYLRDRTELATLEVVITQTPATAPLVDEPWSPGEATRAALGNLVAGLQTAADWMINFALYALPMLIIVLAPLTMIGVLVYRRFFRKPPLDATAV